MLIETLKPIVHWISAHPHIGIAVTFVITFLESLAMVGLLVPGTVMMTAIGTLVGSGILPPWWTLWWAAVGGVAGDTLSYYLGRHYHEDVKNKWPINRYPALLEKGQAFFNRHGKKSVFLGRFFGPMRAIIPLLAGMVNMPFRGFLITDIASSILWAPIYMLPGILLGAASLALPPEIATRLVLIIILLIFIIWLLSWLIQRIINWLVALYTLACKKCTKMLQQTSLGLRVLRLLTPHSIRHGSQFQRLTFIIVLFALFFLLAFNVHQQGLFYHLNHNLYHFFRSLRCPLLDHLAIILSLFGDKVIILPLFIIGFACLAYLKQWRLAWHCLALMFISAAGIEIFKYLIHIPRPSGIMQQSHDFSFPSGHATLVTVYFGFLVTLLTRRTKHRWPYFLSLSLLIILVACSRLYLGAHWLADVIGGVLLGSACLHIVFLSLQRKTIALTHHIKFVIVMLMSFIVLASGYYAIREHHMMRKYQPRFSHHSISFRQWWQHQHTPLIRNNRFGKAIEVINIQWLGDINSIRHTLEKQGWTIAPQRDFNTTLHRIAAQHGSHQLPLLSVLYRDKNPRLVMMKKPQAAKHPLVLRLWQANIMIKHHKQTLYVGTIYNQPIHRGISFLHKHPHVQHHQPVLMPLFLPDVAHLRIKLFNTKQLLTTQQLIKLRHTQQVVLIEG